MSLFNAGGGRECTSQGGYANTDTPLLTVTSSNTRTASAHVGVFTMAKVNDILFTIRLQLE